MKVSELTGGLLDYWVAKAAGIHLESAGTWYQHIPGQYRDGNPYRWAPSERWEQGGPIIERERIEVSPCSPRNWGNVEHRWMALAYLPEPHVNADGPTLLIAAMRAYVASKFGDEVQEPL